MPSPTPRAIHPIVLKFAKSAGYKEPSSDESFEQVVARTMKLHGLDKEDAEVMVCDDQRDEIDDFFFKRFNAR